MGNPRVHQLVDEICALNLLEIADLTELLRKKLGITAPPPGMYAMGEPFLPLCPAKAAFFSLPGVIRGSQGIPVTIFLEGHSSSTCDAASASFCSLHCGQCLWSPHQNTQNPHAGAPQAAPAAPAAEAPKVEEKTEFDVKLSGFDAAAKIKVIKEVRVITSLGLKEAKELVSPQKKEDDSSQCTCV